MKNTLNWKISAVGLMIIILSLMSLSIILLIMNNNSKLSEYSLIMTEKNKEIDDLSEQIDKTNEIYNASLNFKAKTIEQNKRELNELNIKIDNLQADLQCARHENSKIELSTRIINDSEIIISRLITQFISEDIKIFSGLFWEYKIQIRDNDHNVLYDIGYGSNIPPIFEIAIINKRLLGEHSFEFIDLVEENRISNLFFNEVEIIPTMPSIGRDGGIVSTLTYTVNFDEINTDKIVLKIDNKYLDYFGIEYDKLNLVLSNN